MIRRLRTILSLTAIVAVTMTATSHGVELRLRKQCVPQSTLVTVGDIAEIFSTNADETERLKQIDLFPAPAPDQTRMLRVRELQDLLALRGVNLGEHRFSGFSQVQIVSEQKQAVTPQPFNEQTAKRVQRRLHEAILQYFREQSQVDQPRTLQFEMNADLLRSLANSTLPISIHGGNSPWTGMQQLTVSVAGSEAPASFPLHVRVSVPSMVVAAVHSLPRGAILQAADLTVVHGDPRDNSGKNVFHAVEEAVGQQTTRMIAEGKVLTSDAVQAPLMVRRGEMVTVYAKSAGIRIRTTARAKGDGAMGELVAVESLTDRKSYTARVCGPREMEVFAQAATIE